MVLETDETRLQQLRTKGSLQAISLVGCSLKTRYDNREVYEWSYERRNMTHILLCLDTHFPPMGNLAIDEVVHMATAKLPLALNNFSGLKYYWGEYYTSDKYAKLSIDLYKRLMPENPPQDLEEEMLLAKQNLVGVNLLRRQRTTRELRALLEETLARQGQLLALGNAHLLWSESLMARQLDLGGRKDEALEQYKRCVANNAKWLDPKHPVNMATISNLAFFHNQNGHQVEAKELYDQSLGLYLEHRGQNHQDTHIVLRNIADVRRRSGDPEGELECLKMVAKGSEESCGLSNRDTMYDLHELEIWYQMHSRKSEAQDLRQKILEAERILSAAK
jgi:hypothetical protein